jgi:hypothetical protein
MQGVISLLVHSKEDPESLVNNDQQFSGSLSLIKPSHSIRSCGRVAVHTGPFTIEKLIPLVGPLNPRQQPECCQSSVAEMTFIDQPVASTGG